MVADSENHGLGGYLDIGERSIFGMIADCAGYIADEKELERGIT